MSDSFLIKISDFFYPRKASILENLFSNIANCETYSKLLKMSWIISDVFGNSCDLDISGSSPLVYSQIFRRAISLNKHKLTHFYQFTKYFICVFIVKVLRLPSCNLPRHLHILEFLSPIHSFHLPCPSQHLLLTESRK